MLKLSLNRDPSLTFKFIHLKQGMAAINEENTLGCYSPETIWKAPCGPCQPRLACLHTLTAAEASEASTEIAVIVFNVVPWSAQTLMRFKYFTCLFTATLFTILKWTERHFQEVLLSDYIRHKRKTAMSDYPQLFQLPTVRLVYSGWPEGVLEFQALWMTLTHGLWQYRGLWQ